MEVKINDTIYILRRSEGKPPARFKVISRTNSMHWKCHSFENKYDVVYFSDFYLEQHGIIFSDFYLGQHGIIDNLPNRHPLTKIFV